MFKNKTDNRYLITAEKEKSRLLIMFLSIHDLQLIAVGGNRVYLSIVQCAIDDGYRQLNMQSIGLHHRVS